MKSKKPNKKSNKKIKKKPLIIRIFKSKVFKALVLITLLLGITIGIIGVIKVKEIVEAGPQIEEVLENIEPEGYKTFIYDQDGNIIQELHGADANRIYVEYDQIPDSLGKAYVAVEDERFFKHSGVDYRGILRAIYSNITNKKFSNPEGASTITQQVVKNNILTTDVTFERKIQEMYLALELEKIYTKEEILELYVNTVANGHGTNGGQTASKLYFNKDVWDISIAESAVLASITNNPTKYDPITNPENNKDRATRILDKLLEQGYISDAEHANASLDDVYEDIAVVSQTQTKSSVYSYFVDETIQSVIEDLVNQGGYTQTQAYNLLYRGGLSIYATQDQDIQASMDTVFTNEESYPPELEDYALLLKYSVTMYVDGKAVNKYYEDEFDNLEEATSFIKSVKEDLGLSDADFETKRAFENAVYIPQPQAAMVIMDSYSGYVKAINGGRGDKQGSQTFDRATQALRQPGSTFKVLAAYLPALDVSDYTLATVIDDVPTVVKTASGQSYSPKNWYSVYKGLSTVREGIVDSMNVITVKTMDDIGIDVGYQYLLDLGFTSLHEEKVVNGQVYTDKTLTLPLGGLTDGVSPLEVTAAYAAIANGGTYVEPIFYTKILDRDGNLLLTNEQVSRPVMKETTAFLLTDAMKSVVDYGTGQAVQFKEVDMPLAGKTGTTSSTKDLWFAGYSPYYTAVVWMGYDSPKEMAYVKSYHKYIWRDVMEAAHKDLPYKEFDKPSGIVEALICTESGKLANPDFCEHDPRGSTVRMEYFEAGSAPTEVCDVHIKVDICETSGLFASEFCPEETVVSKVMIQRPVPLDLLIFTEDMLNNIADYKYEIPHAMVGEYCNVHTEESMLEEEIDGDLELEDGSLEGPEDSEDSDVEEGEDSEESQDLEDSQVDEVEVDGVTTEAETEAASETEATEATEVTTETEATENEANTSEDSE